VPPTGHRLVGAAGGVTGHTIVRTKEAPDAVGRATMSLSAPALAGPAISFAARLPGAPNAQIWMADVPIGLKPNVRADRRLYALGISEGRSRNVAREGRSRAHRRGESRAGYIAPATQGLLAV